MGLDIGVYSKISKVDCAFDKNGEPIDPETMEPMDWDSYVQVYVNHDFPGRADDVEHKAVYFFKESDAFRAGSYGGFNHWRDQLAELAGYPKEQYEQYGRMSDSHCVSCWSGAEGPFSELINFSDCEGTIGAAVCKKLAVDFADFQEKADARDDFFRATYAEWRAAFELASNDGCLVFR